MAHDYYLTLYTAGSAGVTDTATGSEVDFEAGDYQPLTYEANFPSDGTGSNTLTIEIMGSNTSGSATNVFATMPVVTGSDVHAGDQLRVTAKTNYRYRAAKLTCSGSASDFGVVTVKPTLGGRYTNY